MQSWDTDKSWYNHTYAEAEEDAQEDFLAKLDFHFPK